MFFDGTHLGRNALISYGCNAGIVTSQIITIKFTHEDEARLAFAEFREALVNNLALIRH